MSKSLLTLLALSAGAFGLAACAETTMPPAGKYESSSTATNSRTGTKTTTDKETNVYYDQYGNKKATIETKTTTDPKGLFNKQTTKTVKTVD